VSQFNRNIFKKEHKMVEELEGQTIEEIYNDGKTIGSTLDAERPLKGTHRFIVEDTNETDSGERLRVGLLEDIVTDVISGLTQTIIFTYGMTIHILAFIKGILVSYDTLEGEGTEESPYLIDTAVKLNHVRNNLSAFYLQTANIYLEDYPDWMPIGDDTNDFTGSYDGAGYEITDLISESYPLAGLFGSIDGATLKDIHIVNAVISNTEGTTKMCGILAGQSKSGLINNCIVSGTVTGIGDTGDVMVGGLIGQTVTGITNISYCKSTATISNTRIGAGVAGGFIGSANGGAGIIDSCMATGNVSGTCSSKGGFVGKAGTDTISNCYATGNVSGSGEANGGFCGIIMNGSIITCCYSKGIVSGATVNLGFIGSQEEFEEATASFWDMTISGQTTTPNFGAVGKNTANMTTNSIFTFVTNGGWHTDVWLVENGKYPQLQWEVA
jgi:hypothetical protein